MTHRPNRLAQETSPYLLQHAENPVDWYPWGDEALARAKRENKPIFLSIGYSACHWCHVMERESFEDEAVAKALNAGFVAIKVDREERPDIDAMYMTATVAMSGSGGWPMSVFLAPDGRPFFAGTYFPKENKYGRPGFLTLLARIRELWEKDAGELMKQADELTAAVAAEAQASEPRPVDARAETIAAEQLLKTFDTTWGGFGGAPKFPAPFSLSLLLRYADRTRDEGALTAVTTTLDRMARGGMYDHVGGGFARYSTDAKWHVPHFEKMLYDNAQLAFVYVEAFQQTGDARWKTTATETLDYVLREMQGEHGGYFSATDADSEGVEGKFFVWPKDEILELLPADEAEAVIEAFDVRDTGNWEGHNVLWAPEPFEASAKKLGITIDELMARLQRAKSALYAARKKRVHPLLDDKVLTAWNGLMIRAMAFAGRVLGEPRYLESAERAAAMLSTTMARPDRGLFRTYREGKAHIHAFLEDYAFLSDALVELYEATGNARHLSEALRLAERAVLDFSGAPGQGFYTTANGGEDLVVRMREGSDNATPSPNAVLARALVRLAAHLGRDDLRSLASDAIRAHGSGISKIPRAFATSLDVAARLLSPAVEVALVGPAGDAMSELERALSTRYLPWLVLARGDGTASSHPLLAGKTPVDGKPAAYVCRSFACRAPVTTAAELSGELDDAAASTRRETASAVAGPRFAGRATPQATASFVGGDAGARKLLDLTVTPAGVLVGSYREADARSVTLTALTAKRNVIAFDEQRATAIGDALGDAAKQGIAREAVVLIAILSDDSDATANVARLREHARVETVDVVLVPLGDDRERFAKAIAELAESKLAARIGVYFEAPLGAAQAAALTALPASVDIVAAPFNVYEGDRGLPKTVADGGRAFLALRPLEIAFGSHVAHLVDASPPPPDQGKPVAFVAALAELGRLEQEYRSTIAVHLRGTDDEMDPNELLRWSDELAKAERMLDEPLEVDAFIAQSVTPALGAQWGALGTLGGELGPVVAALRERYLETMGVALKSLARRVITRQAALVQTFAQALGGDSTGSVAASALGASLAEGVSAALVMTRVVDQLATTGHASAVDRAQVEKVRALSAPEAP